MREKTGAYIPMRDDSIDKKLADYINSLNDPSRIRVLFIRETNGVYQFGTKKVYVKVEQDKIYGCKSNSFSSCWRWIYCNGRVYSNLSAFGT